MLVKVITKVYPNHVDRTFYVLWHTDYFNSQGRSMSFYTIGSNPEPTAWQGDSIYVGRSQIEFVNIFDQRAEEARHFLREHPLKL